MGCIVGAIRKAVFAGSVALCLPYGAALADGDGETFSFGASSSASAQDDRFSSFDYNNTEEAVPENFTVSGRLELSASALTEDKAASEFATFQGLKTDFLLTPSENVEIKIGAHVTGYSEHGSNEFKEYDIRYDENYVRYKDDQLRLTLGTQKIAWGRTDEIRPTDQIGGQDMRRYVLNDYDERKLAVPALRAEYFAGDYKIDVASMLAMRDPELAERESIWSVINTKDGHFFGAQPNALFAQFASNATYGQDSNGFGGGGVRISKTSPEFDYAVTAQRIRQSTPFYEVHSDVTDAIAMGTLGSLDLTTLDGPALKLVRPWSWVVGGDFAVPLGSGIFRAEAAWMDDVPVYGLDYTRQSAESLHAVAGYEFYPGDGELMVIVQATAQYLYSDQEIGQREEIYTLNGTIEQSFFQGQWVASLDYSVGLDEHDVYINPRLSYEAIDNHELFVEAHIFDGSPHTAGGFFRNNSMIILGWVYTF